MGLTCPLPRLSNHHRMQRSALVLLVTIAGFLLYAQAADAQGSARSSGPLFYEITKPGTTDTSYLFGTLHLLEKTYVDTMPNLMRALDRASAMYGEIEMDSAVREEARAMMSGGKPLDSLLTPKHYARLDSALMAIAGVPLAFLNAMQPIAVYAVLLNGLYVKRHPENHHSGIPMDIYFQRRARKNGAKVGGLERMQDETEALGKLSTKKQIAIIFDLLSHEQKQMRELDTMLALYASGRTDRIMEEGSDGMSPAQMESLLYKRNRAWLRELPEILNGRSVFLAVGAGHLVGRKGLVDGLRKLGYVLKLVSVM